MIGRALIALAAALALGACASTPRVEVASHHDLAATPDPAFAVIEAAGELFAGSLRFQAMAEKAAAQLGAVGFPPAVDPTAATVAAMLSYSRPTPRIVVRANRRYDPFIGPRYAFSTDSAGNARIVYLRPLTPWRNTVVTTTVYDHRLELAIRRLSDGAPIWEGEATIVTGSSAPESALDSALAALFVDFPGENGDVRVVELEPQSAEAAK